MITVEEIHLIREQIKRGIIAAQDGGVQCGFPPSVTVTSRTDDGREFSITIPFQWGTDETDRFLRAVLAEDSAT